MVRTDLAGKYELFIRDEAPPALFTNLVLPGWVSTSGEGSQHDEGQETAKDEVEDGDQ